ncbi:D-beta-hydroxybutyrate dehydrogenase, mitochondrial [Frankliniella fusca]|uniref:D-beta-hydroxybutyrate dehydrogenase, mitochondrial n=1 Tax=Frankliniella fusca TaxID=407009 RepID=A0AAE1H4G2_9NEOP|nr:D-beta-hydroxybutyrate dehydrogenase, mitochondrial [Frankliniella fusca]
MGAAPYSLRSMAAGAAVPVVGAAVALAVSARLFRPYGALISSLWQGSAARWPPSPARAVVLTGCDRGLGFSLATHCHSLGLTVFAGVLDAASPGARRLVDLGVRVVPLDVTDGRSVQGAVQVVQQALKDDARLSLSALVNNAGVLVFGEFGWQTPRQVSLQLDVNLAGTMRVTRAFLPLLRAGTSAGPGPGRGRVVVVTSHCALAALPALSVYAATKAGLQAWADALRMEQAQYGVPVVQVVPGSFTHLSGILAAHAEHAREMEAAMTEEDRQFYGDYPRRFHEYLAVVSSLGREASERPCRLPDDKLHEMFEAALLSLRPAARYVHEPWRYTLYHSLMRLAPTGVRDWLAIRFASLPSFKEKRP